jgi:hypothetical protein
MYCGEKHSWIIKDYFKAYFLKIPKGIKESPAKTYLGQLSVINKKDNPEAEHSHLPGYL